MENIQDPTFWENITVYLIGFMEFVLYVLGVV